MKWNNSLMLERLRTTSEAGLWGAVGSSFKVKMTLISLHFCVSSQPSAAYTSVTMDSTYIPST